MDRVTQVVLAQAELMEVKEDSVQPVFPKMPVLN